VRAKASGRRERGMKNQSGSTSDVSRPMCATSPAGKKDGRYSKDRNGATTVSASLARRQIPNGHANAERPFQRSAIRRGWAGGLRASSSLSTQSNSSIALLKKKRRLAVPYPSCRLGGPSVSPNRINASALGPPTSVNTKRWSISYPMVRESSFARPANLHSIAEDSESGLTSLCQRSRVLAPFMSFLGSSRTSIPTSKIRGPSERQSLSHLRKSAAE
jgi:hypothetical protein